MKAFETPVAIVVSCVGVVDRVVAAQQREADSHVISSTRERKQE